MTGAATTSIRALIAERAAACGTTKVVAIDGPSGSGKSTLADVLAAATGADVVRLEDIYPGWHGLAETPPMIVDGALEPIATGVAGSLRRWDWEQDCPGSSFSVPPVPLLILDGCGSGSRIIRPFLSILIWLDGPQKRRKERALARDGDTFAPWWNAWAAQERALFAAEQTKASADVRLTMI